MRMASSLIRSAPHDVMVHLPRVKRWGAARLALLARVRIKTSPCPMSSFLTLPLSPAGCVEAPVRYHCTANLWAGTPHMADLIVIAYDTEATAA